MGIVAVSQIQLLHLEDSPLDAELVRIRLAKDGLRVAVHRVVGHDDFLEALRSRPFDLILADYSLPGFDGLKALEYAQAHAHDTPFLFVSGVLGEEVAIETLKQGATDYVLKHRLDRLAPAVRRALKETRERAERKRAEQALRESERMHRLTLDSIRGHAILTISIDGQVTNVNAGAAGVLGYRDDDLVGRPSSAIFAAEDVAAGIPRRELDVARRRGIAEDERWHVRKDGTRFWASTLVTPLLDEAEQIRGFTKVVRDMTEWKRAEEALRDADRRKDEFLAMLAHELRNPLSSIQNAAHLVRHASLPPERLAWARDIIVVQVKHLARLVDDLLDVARITRGKIRLRLEGVDMAQVLARAAEVARPLLDDRRHEFVATLDPGPLRVEGDPTRLEQVMTNLLTNAAKYTDPGGRIELSARVEGDRLAVRVADTGVGIAPDMLPRVFDLFAQVDNSLDRSQGGLGIGLTIAQRLVALHGGTIEVASPGAGRGSVFTVRLPLLAPPAAAEVVRPAEAARPAANPRAGAKVLVVDDNLATATALADLLQLSGFEVVAAHDGFEAIAAARRQLPEIVLLDIGLPGQDGYQVVHQLRQEEGVRHARIIAITGYGEDQARRRSREAGFDFHLVKPVDYDTLLDLIAHDAPGGSPRTSG